MGRRKDQKSEGGFAVILDRTMNFLKINLTKQFLFDNLANAKELNRGWPENVLEFFWLRFLVFSVFISLFGLSFDN